MKNLSRILVDLILAFIALLAFGQFYSWFDVTALIAMAVYAVLAVLIVLRIVRCRKAGNDQAADKTHFLFRLFLLLPVVASIAILILAFSAMAIYG